jgi:hypothetical protein
MTALNKPEDVARLLAGTGFSREQIAGALLEEFGELNPSIVDAALAEKAKWDAGLDAEVRKEQDAAIAAEHDDRRAVGMAAVTQNGTRRSGTTLTQVRRWMESLEGPYVTTGDAMEKFNLSRARGAGPAHDARRGGPARHAPAPDAGAKYHKVRRRRRRRRSKPACWPTSELRLHRQAGLRLRSGARAARRRDRGARGRTRGAARAGGEAPR